MSSPLQQNTVPSSSLLVLPAKSYEFSVAHSLEECDDRLMELAKRYINGSPRLELECQILDGEKHTFDICLLRPSRGGYMTYARCKGVIIAGDTANTSTIKGDITGDTAVVVMLAVLVLLLCLPIFLPHTNIAGFVALSIGFWMIFWLIIGVNCQTLQLMVYAALQ